MRLFARRICMADQKQDLDAAHLRALAAKCRRLASGTSDTVTVAALRQMAAEYDTLAANKEQQIPPAPARIL
jgi:hypothetical protein